MALIWFFYIYQEIVISDKSIAQFCFKFTGLHSKTMCFRDMVSWKPEHPYKLYNKQGNVLTIPWTTFNRADQKLLFEKLKALNLTEIK